MKKTVFYLFMFTCVLFLLASCNGNGTTPGSQVPNLVPEKKPDEKANETSKIGKTTEELDKQKNPNSGVQDLSDKISGKTYEYKSGGKLEGTLTFDSKSNVVSLKCWGTVIKGIRTMNGTVMDLDFTAFNDYATKYGVEDFCAEKYAIFKARIEELEKKTNKTKAEEGELQGLKALIKEHESVEAYKKAHPEEETFKNQKQTLQAIAKELLKLRGGGFEGNIEPTEGSHITFKKFFFAQFMDGDGPYNKDLSKPIVKNNIKFAQK